MPYDFSNFDRKAKETEEHLRSEFTMIRTGRAAPAILDGVLVDAYGSKMSMKEVASITVEDPKTIRISPWDQGLVRSIEKGIIDSGLGLSVSVDEKGLRVIFPELTGERRSSLIKLMKQKLEDSRVTLRLHRDDTKKDIEAKEKEGGMGEDDKFRYLEDLQKRVDAENKKLDDMADKKEKEILE